MLKKRLKSSSKKRETKTLKPTNKKWTQSGSIKLAIAVTFLTGLLIIVSGTGAQSLISGKTDGKNRLLKTEVPAKANRIAGSFDVRLSGADLGSLLRKSSSAEASEAILQTALENKSTIEGSFAELKANNPRAEMKPSILTGAVEILDSPDGLTKAAPGRTGEEIVREFIDANKALYGLSDAEIADLNFIGESISPESGLRMVRVEQIINGRPVFQSETRFILDREGRIVRSLGLMVPKATPQAEALENLLSPQDALQRTMTQLGVALETETMRVVKNEEDGFRTEMRVENPNIGGTVTSKLVYFAAAPGVLIPAWSQTVFGVKEDWYVLVDAREGAMLWRKQIRDDVSTHDAAFRVYVQADGITPADNPAPQSPSAAVPGGGTQFPGIAPSIVAMSAVQNLTASPNGWIDDCPGGVCTAAETQTLGNNALACVDRGGTANVCDTDAGGVLDGNGRPTGNPDGAGRNRNFLGTAPRDFQTNFLPPPQGGNPEAGQTATGAGTSGTNALDQFRRASVVQQFYVTNWYHDRLFALGFNTAAGNFQNNIFAGGGVGNDRVLIDVQDSSGTDNANFSTPADGTSGRSQMFRFTGPTIDRDGGLDTEILIHELTHGTSNRLIGNATGLQWRIGQSLGEGWSDFYAMALLNNTNADNPNANYASGAYATYKAFGFVTYLDNYVYGIRRFPYSTVNTVNPLTWGDIDQTTINLGGGIATSPLDFSAGGALEVHNAGEIWANTLWEMRSRIIAANAGSVPTGNQIALQIVTDAMKMTPANPSFIQARDALVAADCATNACANEESIWNAFADRGLGYKAAAPLAHQWGFITGAIGISESSVQTNLNVNTVTVSDSGTNNTGFIDPNEPVFLNINLRNPWLGAAKTATGVSATLTSSTAGVTIINGTTTYPNIAPNSNANKTPAAAALAVRAPTAGVCGNRLDFTLTVTSSLGTVAHDFSLRMGAPSGTLAPVTYTRTFAATNIPDNNGAGLVDALTITDDYEIADVNLRLNSVTHTFVNDINFGVRGPNGYGGHFLAITGLSGTGAGNGNNFTNTVIDDEAANNLLTVNNTTDQPYTNSYFSVFNAPQWATPGYLGVPADSVPQLSRFDGTSTLGTWRAMLSDQFAGDVGTWAGWSLIVTPRAFACTGFVPTAANVPVSGMVTDADGRMISRVIVTLTDSTGQTRSAQTNTFGYFRFDGIAAGQTYTINGQAKGYSFVPQVISIEDEITGLNLTAQQ